MILTHSFTIEIVSSVSKNVLLCEIVTAENGKDRNPCSNVVRKEWDTLLMIFIEDISLQSAYRLDAMIQQGSAHRSKMLRLSS